MEQDNLPKEISEEQEFIATYNSKRYYPEKWDETSQSLQHLLYWYKREFTDYYVNENNRLRREIKRLEGFSFSEQYDDFRFHVSFVSGKQINKPDQDYWWLIKFDTHTGGGISGEITLQSINTESMVRTFCQNFFKKNE